MPERMIPCPECIKRRASGLPLRWNLNCSTCGIEETKVGTIPDRRRRTANDRAVERIKARCEQEMDADVFHAVGGRVLADIISVIIREEAERHE